MKHSEKIFEVFCVISEYSIAWEYGIHNLVTLMPLRKSYLMGKYWINKSIWQGKIKNEPPPFILVDCENDV